LLAFVAEQIDILPESIDTYIAEERNRQRHAIECQEQLGLRPFGKRFAAELTSALLPQAIENDRLAHLAELVMRNCRERRIVAPSAAALERLCANLRHHARREAYRRLTNGLSAEQRKRLDALTQRREEGGQTWLTWLRQMPEAASLTDQAIDLFDRLVGAMFRKAEGRHARAFQADARAINDKVRLFARVGAALITGRNDQRDGYDAIIALMPWDKFCTSVAEAEALARPDEFDAYKNLGEHYAGVRRWSPAFLEAFLFESVPASASLMRAIEVLREANRSEGSSLPKSAPTAFIRQRWAAQVMPDGTIDRRYYELCVLSELRDRLRAGDVWVTGSRQYKSYEERLISTETLEKLRQSGDLPIAVEANFERFIAARRTLLDERMTAVDARAAEGKLPDVTLTKGVLKISPIEKSTPPEAEALAARLYAMLPRIRITDLLVEVATWTLFPDCFTHLRTGETAADNQILMAGLLADGLNLGLTRMAEACSIGSLGQLAWTSDWHIRDETYHLALRCLVNQQQREPFAEHFGSGMASSSDGQFFQAAGYGRAAANLNAHYGHKPGFKAYTHISDRYGPFYTKLIAATASEALHVLDALLYHQSEVSTRRHHTDGGGDSDHVFALCTLVGLQFAPRIPDLKHRRLYSFGKPSAYPALEPMMPAASTWNSSAPIGWKSSASLPPSAPVP
jgi:hypothetical protein